MLRVVDLCMFALGQQDFVFDFLNALSDGGNRAVVALFEAGGEHEPQNWQEERTNLQRLHHFLQSLDILLLLSFSGLLLFQFTLQALKFESLSGDAMLAVLQYTFRSCTLLQRKHQRTQDLNIGLQRHRSLRHAALLVYRGIFVGLQACRLLLQFGQGDHCRGRGGRAATAHVDARRQHELAFGFVHRGGQVRQLLVQARQLAGFHQQGLQVGNESLTEGSKVRSHASIPTGETRYDTDGERDSGEKRLG